jgi:hypothetical protein
MNLSAEFPAKYTLSEPEEIECLAENDTTEKVTVTVGYMGTHEDYDDYFNGLYEYEAPQYGRENVSQETITFAGVQCRALVYSHDDKLSKLVLYPYNKQIMFVRVDAKDKSGCFEGLSYFSAIQ